MTATLEKECLQITVNSKGAELQSIYSKETGLDYLWNGDPAYWGKKSPVLFPIVGGLKNNSYQYNGITYKMSRHGFARDMDFVLTAQTADSISFSLAASDATLPQYPFLFSLMITYSINQNKVTCTYTVYNTDQQDIFFSIGAHPAFKVPLAAGTTFNDYFLLFDQLETAGKWPLSPEGLILKTALPYFENSNRIELTKPLFYGDALVFDHLQSTGISLQSALTKHGFHFTYHEFPYMGIWSAKDADFVCIEPWCGIADSVDANGDITQKTGIHSLIPGQEMSRSWSVQVY